MLSPMIAQYPSTMALGRQHPLCHHNISIHPCARAPSLAAPASAIAPGGGPCRNTPSRFIETTAGTGRTSIRLASSSSSLVSPMVPTQPQCTTRISSSNPDDANRRSSAVAEGAAVTATATATATATPAETAKRNPSHSAPQLVPLLEGVYPTFVPRNDGIQDGEWSDRDDVMVRAAIEDAARQVAFIGGGRANTQQQQQSETAGGAVSAKAAPAISPSDVVVLACDLGALQDLMGSLGQPKYRAQQLMDEVLNGARNMMDVKTLPLPLRSKLSSLGIRTGRSLLHHSVGDADGTRKFLLQLHDGRIIETVGIPTEDRLTVCVSSQVGCPMRCTFCATGKGGFARNLSPAEIVDQVLTVQEQFGRRVSNVVFMGMGEPMLNLPSVAAAYAILNKKLEIGGQSITISTVGVPNTIRRLAHAPTKATLAVSLHAPNQKLRESLIPSAKAYPLDALMEDCAYFLQTTGRRITFEYTLLSGINDESIHAKELAELLNTHGLLFSHVNIIPWNPVDESQFNRPSRNRVFAFQRNLEGEVAAITGRRSKGGKGKGWEGPGFSATIRETRGLEAAAACGQLRNQFQKQPLPGYAVPL